MSVGFLAGRAQVCIGVLLLLLVGAGCERRGGGIEVPDAALPTRDAGPPPDAAPLFPDTGIGRTDLTIERVVPGHGPFTGGNTVVLRGSGFTADAVVTFGGREVQGDDHVLVDTRRLQVVVPAGEVGTADVAITVGDRTTTLADGYTYDALYVDPPRGATAGGTFITLLGSGTSFAEGDRVLLGRTECTDVQVVGPTRITCRTPPMSTGYVDVTVLQATDGTDVVAVDAFQYYDSSDPNSGGLGGGTITGALNVSVIDAATGNPLDAAFAIVGEDLATEHQGLTNALGQVTFSGPDLAGPVTVHVAKHCYERTSVVAFDASDVTVFLYPWRDPACAAEGNPGGGGGRGRNGAFVEGHLRWPIDMTQGRWQNVPASRPGWERVAYVYTTVYDVGYTNPDPSFGGRSRVLESPMQDGGYPFRIFARPAGLAVYALAGLEEISTGRFVPYVMGVARNVLAGPGEVVSGVDVWMDIPLDHELTVELGALPSPGRTGPDRFLVEAYLDLGGEGVVRRRVNDQDFDVLRARSAAGGFRFLGEPALGGALSDGRYRVVAGWYTSEWDDAPYTVAVLGGVTAVDSVVQMPDFLGVPRAVSPAYGERLPADRILRWETVGGEVPDLHVVMMTGGDGNPAWRMFVRGDVNEAPIPDLSTIPGLDDIASGLVSWAVYAVKIPGFDFDTFSYNHLNDRYWSHYSLDYFVAQR